MFLNFCSQLSFYGNHIYDRIIPRDHFLKLLDKAVDFSFVNELCRDAYTPDFGRPAYGPEMMFKIIFLQFLYDVSDRRIEEEVNFNLVLKWFVGLGYKSEKKPSFGYKAHATMDSDSELITKLDTTPGNTHDGKAFPKVVDTQSRMATADKAYDSNKNHRLLKRKGTTSAIIIKKNRKNPRLRKHQMKPEIIAAQRERPKIERKFAELKRFHGLRGGRDWGLAKTGIQFTMIAIACNLKRILKLLFHQGYLGTSKPGSFHQGITVPILA